MLRYVCVCQSFKYCTLSPCYMAILSHVAIVCITCLEVFFSLYSKLTILFYWIVHEVQKDRKTETESKKKKKQHIQPGHNPTHTLENRSTISSHVNRTGRVNDLSLSNTVMQTVIYYLSTRNRSASNLLQKCIPLPIKSLVYGFNSCDTTITKFTLYKESFINWCLLNEFWQITDVICTYAVWLQ